METRTSSELTRFTPQVSVPFTAGTSAAGSPGPGTAVVRTGSVVRAIDALVVVAAVSASVVVGAEAVEGEGRSVVVPVGALVALLWVALLWNTLLRRGASATAPARRGLLNAGHVAAALVVLGGWGMVLAVARVWQLGGLTPAHALIGVTLSTALVVGVRVVASSALEREARRTPRQVIIVGTGPRGQRLFHQVRATAAGYRVVGLVDDLCCSSEPDLRVRMLGPVDDLDQILMRTVVDEVLVALPVKSHYATIQNAIRSCERVGVPVAYAADLFEFDFTRPRYGAARPFPAVAASSVAEDDVRLLVKRLLDVLGASLALLALAPVLAVVALLVKVTSPGPVLFVQERHGLHKRRFRMLKFRTMVVDAERRLAELEHLNEASGPAFKIRRDPRLTPVGAFLRKWSLDELPQLWNVLRGEMSLVGPRPMSVRDVGLFDEPWLMRRFSVRPGLTCLWQVSGRSNLTFDDWIALDLAYIDSWSLGLDFRVLARTVPAVMRGSGAM